MNIHATNLSAYAINSLRRFIYHSEPPLPPMISPGSLFLNKGTDSTFSIAFSSSSLKVNISILAMVSALLCHPMHVYLFNHIDKLIYVCLAYLTVSYRSFSFCTSTSVFALSADLTSTLPFSSSEPTFVSFSFSSSFLSSVLSALSCSAF